MLMVITQRCRCIPERSEGETMEGVVGIPRIELEHHAPETCILPLYYIPFNVYFTKTLYVSNGMYIL
jgi:hypothetical protein